jgi:hydroxymethylpyrimidine/phosphomethylpyrimidine kinase
MIVFFTPNASAIEQLVKIQDLRSVAISEGEVTLIEKGKQAVVIQAKNSELAGRIHWFVTGQARMIKKYRESWLL